MNFNHSSDAQKSVGLHRSQTLCYARMGSYEMSLRANWCQKRGFSSVVERLLDKQDVTGSSPVTPIKKPLDFGLEVFV